MNYLILFLLLVLNFGISWWNARAAGAYLTESKIVGGWSRFMTWCGLVMSACGFTWVYLCLATMISVAAGWLTPEWGQTMFKLGYLVIILPLLGSGIAITVDSIMRAARERTLGSAGVAAWNTFAQVHNTWEAARHAPSAFREVMDAFSPKKVNKDNAMAILVIVLVICALAGGILTTAAIARASDRRVAFDVA